jgi:putative ATPase
VDLFLAAEQNNPNNWLKPLADRIRPKDLNDFVGQEGVIGAKGNLRQFLAKKYLPSLIIWGPPGTGKTSLARLLSAQIEATVESKNAIDLGAKEIKDLGRQAQERRLQYQKPTVIFVDEIHRLNKSQQDNFLPFVERGDFILIGATTENPSFEINAALLSRCQVIRLNALTEKDLKKILARAAEASNLNVDEVLDQPAQEHLSEWAAGDARAIINMFENILAMAVPRPLTLDKLKEILSESRPLYYDKKATSHYDTISAFIKSIRGSDADAALYYLARMLKAGEDPRFIARRLIILASEDVGNADPRALTVAVSGFQAVEMVGLPEARINLAQVVTYLATAPKSNRSYEALNLASAEVEKTGALGVPANLRGSDNVGYQYAHDSEKGWVKQEYFPQGVKNKKYYEPTERGFEKTIKQFLAWLKS